VQARKSSRKQGLPVNAFTFLRALLEALFGKLKYDEDMNEADYEDSDMETDFLNLRKRILSFQETIAGLNPTLYSDSVYDLVARIFTDFASGVLDTWQDVEVALFQMHAFGEPLKRSLTVYHQLTLGNGHWDNSTHLHRFSNLLSQAVSLGTFH
jgi:exportin-T